MGSFHQYPTLFYLLALTTFLLLSTAEGKKVARDRCEKGITLLKGKKAEINIPLPLKDEDDENAKKCFWGIYATKDCVPALSCKINMAKSDDCTDSFVKVTDGSGGSKVFCGKTKFENIRAGEGLRHIFLVVKSEDRKGYDGIKCTAKCAKEGEGEKLEKVEERKIDLRCVCGLENKDDRIVGGLDAKVNEFPYQAAVVYPNTRSPSCGASVINDRFVLTAAHCFWFEEKQPSDIEVLIRANLLDMTKKKSADKTAKLGTKGFIQSSGYNKERKTDADENTLRFKVTEIINHPLFTEDYDYDYALLRLDGKINLGDADAPTPVCLPNATTFDEELKDWPGKELMVTGWGLADENAGGTTRQLQKLDVPLMTHSDCFKSNPVMVTDRMICAGFAHGEKDACTGDSGGPLVKKLNSKQSLQVGIVSWGEGCARAGKPGVYSKVTEMMQWIHLHSSEQSARWCQETN